MNIEVTQELNMYLECIRKTIELGQKSKEEVEKNISEREFFTLDMDFKLSESEKVLYDYLCTLDFESLAVIQTLMTIGRDSSCVEDDGTYNYQKVRKYMDILGWPDDKVETASYLSEKVPLPDYIIKGCERIGLVV